MNDKVCHVFRDNADSSRLLVICHYDVPADRAVAVATAILSNITADDVIVFDTMLDWKFNASASERFAPPLLRKIETDASREKRKESKDCPFLEAPNLIDSLGAAVISRRQINRHQGRVYVSLESSRLLDIDTLRAFEAVLEYSGSGSSSSSSTSSASYKQLLASMMSRRPNPLFL